MKYQVTAKQRGNSVQYQIEAKDTGDALTKALDEANRIFGYKPAAIGDTKPTVSVKPLKEKKEKEEETIDKKYFQPD